MPVSLVLKIEQIPAIFLTLLFILGELPFR